MILQPSAALRRPITDEEIETFWRDGAVCLRDEHGIYRAKPTIPIDPT